MQTSSIGLDVILTSGVFFRQIWSLCTNALLTSSDFVFNVPPESLLGDTQSLVSAEMSHVIVNKTKTFLLHVRRNHHSLHFASLILPVHISMPFLTDQLSQYDKRRNAIGDLAFHCRLLCLMPLVTRCFTLAMSGSRSCSVAQSTDTGWETRVVLHTTLDGNPSDSATPATSWSPEIRSQISLKTSGEITLVDSFSSVSGCGRLNNPLSSEWVLPSF